MNNERTNHRIADSIALFCALVLGIGFFGVPWQSGYRIALDLLSEVSSLWVIPVATGVAVVALILRQIKTITRAQARYALCAAGIIGLIYFVNLYLENRHTFGTVTSGMRAGFWLGLIGAVGLAVQVVIPFAADWLSRYRANRAAAAAAATAPSGLAATFKNLSENPAVAYVGRQFRSNIQTYTLVLALLAIWIYFSTRTGGVVLNNDEAGKFFAWKPGLFLNPQNFSNLFRQMTITALLSVGMVLVIVTGGIDLSVGKLAGFVSVVVAVYQARVWGPHITPNQEFITTAHSVLVGLGTGLLFGVIQGYIIAYLRVTAFIVTLGSMWLLNGLILVQTEGKTIPANQPMILQIAKGNLSDALGLLLAAAVVAWLFYSMFMGRQKKQKYGFELSPIALDIAKTVFFSALVVVFVVIVNQYRGVQMPVLILAAVAIAVSYVSTNTRFGRYVYAIGGNREAARLSGINIKQTLFLVFVLMGTLCGVSGVVMASYVGYGTIAAGQGYELDAIAACILGGTSTLGGVGTVFGAMVGALIMGSLTNGLQLMNTPASWQYVLKGIVLVAAVYIDVRLKQRKS